eukprot:scaffold7955_cov93-Cylindrotheca_fusiformis.AAC.1
MEMQQYTANQAAQAPPPPQAPMGAPPPQHLMAPPPVLSEHAHHQYYTDPNAAYAAQYAHDPYAQHAQYHAA